MKRDHRVPLCDRGLEGLGVARMRTCFPVPYGRPQEVVLRRSE